jgi:hypothetical protein
VHRAGASMASFYGRPDLHWIPIDDVDPLRVALAWMQPGSLLVDEFAASVASSSSDEFGRRSRYSREYDNSAVVRLCGKVSRARIILSSLSDSVARSLYLSHSSRHAQCSCRIAIPLDA